MHAATLLEGQAHDVPLLDGPQAQGDILIIPVTAPVQVEWMNVPVEGIQVLVSDVTGHHHTLCPGPQAHGVTWAVAVSETTLGHLNIPRGESAWLVHSEEHSPSGIAPGCYALHRKRHAPMVVQPPPAPASWFGGSYFLDDWDDGFALVDD